jgi:hypothetical protein
MADAWSYLPGATGDAWTRMYGNTGDAWARLPGPTGDAWERLTAGAMPGTPYEIIDQPSAINILIDQYS